MIGVKPTRIHGAVRAALLAAMLASAACGASGSARHPGFQWGQSTSSFQNEGGDVDDNWHYYIARDGLPAYGRAVDFEHRYAEDLALGRDLGLDTWRFSIAWGRVVPSPGQVSEEALAYYDDVFAELRRDRIRPLLTLDHWNYPKWVYDQGAMTNPKTVDDYLSFVTTVVDRYGAEIDRYLTFNEPYFYELTEQQYHPLSRDQAAAMQANLVDAHRRAYDLIHERDPGASVSANYAWIGDGVLGSLASDPFLDAVEGRLDFAALDYYVPAYHQLQDLVPIFTGRAWAARKDPFGIYTALRAMQRRFPGLPVFITENGDYQQGTDAGPIAPSDGYTREESLSDTIYWVERAMQDGVPVVGYSYWALTDDWEWGVGFAFRLGLYTVNPDDPDLTRTPTAAVDVYRDIIRRGGVKDGYAPIRRPDAADCETATVDPADRATCHAAAAGVGAARGSSASRPARAIG